MGNVMRAKFFDDDGIVERKGMELHHRPCGSGSKTSAVMDIIGTRSAT